MSFIEFLVTPEKDISISIRGFCMPGKRNWAIGEPNFCVVIVKIALGLEITGTDHAPDQGYHPKYGSLTLYILEDARVWFWVGNTGNGDHEDNRADTQESVNECSVFHL